MEELSDLNNQIQVLIDELDALKIVECEQSFVHNQTNDNIELTHELKQYK